MANENIGPVAMTPEQLAQEQLVAAQEQALDPAQVSQTGVYTPPVEYGGYLAHDLGLKGYEHAGNTPEWLKGGQLAARVNPTVPANAPALSAATPEMLNSSYQAATQVPEVPTMPADGSQFDERPVQAPTQNAQSAMPFDKSANAISSSFDAATRANKAAMDAAALKGDAQAAQYGALNSKLEQQELEASQKRAKIEAQVNDSMAELQNTSDQVKNFKFQDFWADKSTGQKVMAGIALALGGIGGAFTGKGDNKALDVINKAIEQDLQLQKLNFQKLGAQADMTKGSLAALNQKFGNEMQAEAAARAIAIQSAQNQLSAIASKYDGKELQAKYATLNSQLEVQKQEKIAIFQKASLQQAALGESLKGISHEGDLTPAQVHAQALASGDKTYPDRFVPGYGAAINKEAAIEFQKYRNEVEPAMASVKRIQGIVKQLTTLDRLSPIATVRARELEGELVPLVGNLRLPYTGPGQLLEMEYKRLRKAIGDSGKASAILTGKGEEAAMATVLKKLSADMNIRLKSAGLQPRVDASDVKFSSKFGAK